MKQIVLDWKYNVQQDFRYFCPMQFLRGNHFVYRQGLQENFWAPGQKKTWSPSSNSPNNDTQTKSTTVCHKQGISTTKMNWWIDDLENSFLLDYLSGKSWAWGCYPSRQPPPSQWTCLQTDEDDNRPITNANI